MNKIRFRKPDCTISHVVTGGRLRRIFASNLDFFKVVWKLLSKYFAFAFVIKRPILACNIGPKKFLMTTQIKIFWKKFWSPLHGHFDKFWPFSASNNQLFDFLNVVLELSRSCLGIIFGLKRSTFGCVFSSKCW